MLSEKEFEAAEGSPEVSVADDFERDAVLFWVDDPTWTGSGWCLERGDETCQSWAKL